jgi:hypothetical protein
MNFLISLFVDLDLDTRCYAKEEKSSESTLLCIYLLFSVIILDC